MIPLIVIMKHILFVASAFLALLPAFAQGEPSADTGTNIDVVAIAKSAVPNLVYDRSAPITVTSSNGWSLVTFPRFYNPWTAVTNGPTEAARIWVDETTGAILPEPGTIPLTDDEALAVCRTKYPDMAPLLQGPTEIKRVSSLTIVTFFKTPEGPSAPTNGLQKIYDYWIDTRSGFVFNIEMFL